MGSYEQAALYSMLVIIGVLVMNFRSLTYSLIAALPLAVGVLQTFGLLGFLNIPLNPANLIALPLILGIGVDYGVHIVHEFRECKGPYRMSPGTAVAVLVDALTTIVGFGSLMIATHQGLQSLGRVLTIAVTCCLFSSLVMLPATLGLDHAEPAGGSGCRIRARRRACPGRRAAPHPRRLKKKEPNGLFAGPVPRSLSDFAWHASRRAPRSILQLQDHLVLRHVDRVVVGVGVGLLARRRRWAARRPLCPCALFRKSNRSVW